MQTNSATQLCIFMKNKKLII